MEKWEPLGTDDGKVKWNGSYEIKNGSTSKVELLYDAAIPLKPKRIQSRAQYLFQILKRVLKIFEYPCS